MHVQTAFRSRASGLLPFSVLFAGRSFCRAVGSLLDLRDRGFSHRDPAVLLLPNSTMQSSSDTEITIP
jgi:hypothetical protein